MSQYYQLSAEQHFTTAGEQNGNLKAALSNETAEDLQIAYVCEVSSSHWSHPVSGGNARRWIAYVAGELLRRGITVAVVRDALGERRVEVK